MPDENVNVDELDLTGLSEPEFAKMVFKEIKKHGDNTKENYNALRTNYEELKKSVDSMMNDNDTLVEEKFQKLSTDIVVRQEALDKKFIADQKAAQERMDAIEVAMQRAPKGTDPAGADDEKQAREFKIHCLSVSRKSDSGVSFEEIDEIKPNVDEYKEYRKSFEAWARKYGGAKDRVMPEERLKALQVGIDPDGGITVPVVMSNMVIERVFESDPIRSLASIESITSGAIEWMVEIDEAGYEWEGEVTGETTITGETSTPGWRKKKIVVHTLAARPRATQTLLEDSGINVETWLANKVADKFSRAEAAAFVTGDGIGKPRGFLTHTSGTSWGQVEQVAMGAASSLTADGFINVKYALKEQFLMSSALAWLVNRTTVQAAMKLKYGSGEYIWKPSQIANDPSSSILSIPVRMSTTMPEVASDALSVALADWRRAYMIVDRLGITIQRDPYTVKPFVEFYTRKRVGGDVIDYDAIKIGKISA